ncbi:hypothetical protein AVEN_157643-1 [Araneus ventricosus]|uniref:Uncharacterized protein n=1 Tax=Araneus ventricosus TaxID=182803 RepID=A0A4Y2VKY7_ARAVE|nr:hypothetical protein AVEN_56288-1 [Araneus ventricosus]GBO24974.1 hypothetical protein AVEN_157643-1 [Araneus ventricosus]
MATLSIDEMGGYRVCEDDICACHSGVYFSRFQSCTVRNLDEWCNSQVWLVSENGYRFITSFGQKMTTIKRRHLSNISKFRL